MNDILLLALLLGGRKYGYQLKREAGWMTRQAALHNNIVYPRLRKFLQEGWVSKRSVPGDRGQTRQQYALTAEGRRTLMERLSQFADADAASEEAFRMRLGLIEYLKPEVRESLFAGREKYLQHRDEALESLQDKMDLGKFGREIVRYMRKQIEMEQDWIGHLRRMARAASRD
ncbi:MAG TPA: helix-turn-helix transcriptional regulator [Candidatus Sulfotelmatobacter sp.]|nr:helix-turn-helix transcriptional regulator [Candidatus Sulfotelmatobacter sp.]